MFRKIALVLLPLLSACVVGPAYKPPNPDVGSGWTESQATGGVDERWWLGFGDPQLTALIEQASASNPDLRAASARLAEARAAVQAAHGGALPRGDATASYSRNQLSENGEIPIAHIPDFPPNFPLFDAGFDATWEVDLWGRQKRTMQAARARAQAADAARRGVLISLRAEVARTYFELRADQARLASALNDAQAQRLDAELVAVRFKGGEASRVDLVRAEAQARGAAASVPGVEADARADAYALAALLGKRPETVVPDLWVRRPLPTPPPTLGVGLRSDMLRRRPDIVQAERTLAATTADIGVATADLFPRLSLIGAVGQQSQSLSEFTFANSNRYELGPTVSWQFLQRGTILANIRAADARAKAAAASYESAVFAALADSETALNRFIRAGAAEVEAEAALAQSRQALELARQRYRAGEDDLAPVLAAQSGVAESERRQTDAQLARATSAVAVFKALGV